MGETRMSGGSVLRTDAWTKLDERDRIELTVFGERFETNVL
jgi:hypothetical protein